MQDTFARATHSAGRPSAARDDRVSCIQTTVLNTHYTVLMINYCMELELILYNIVIIKQIKMTFGAQM